MHGTLAAEPAGLRCLSAVARLCQLIRHSSQLRQQVGGAHGPPLARKSAPGCAPGGWPMGAGVGLGPGATGARVGPGWAGPGQGGRSQ